MAGGSRCSITTLNFTPNCRDFLCDSWRLRDCRPDLVTLSLMVPIGSAFPGRKHISFGETNGTWRQTMRTVTIEWPRKQCLRKCLQQTPGQAAHTLLLPRAPD